jgi:hypothetical protein
MNQKITQEEIIRKYLLGTLSEPELSEIEQELFFNEELSRTADLIEDEIIEQYLDQELDAHDRKAVETHFLRPPAHRHKLDFARLLRHRFESPVSSNSSAAPEPPVPPPAGNFFAFMRSYGALAGALVFGSSSLYLGVALQKATVQIHVLTAQVQRREDSQTSPVVLSMNYGVKRGQGQLRKIVILPTTRTIKVDLLLPSRFAELFDVRLLDRRHDEEQEIWSKKDVKPSVPSQPRLTFDIPTQGIRTSTYDLVVNDSAHGSSVIYPFDISVDQSP